MSYWYPLAMPTIGEEEIEAVVSVLRSGNTTMGEKVEEFEDRFAAYIGSHFAVMVNSGSSADLLIAFGLDLLGEILVPAVTWPTHVWSWKMAECPVRYVDVGELNTTAEILEANIGTQTTTISLVHLMGIPCDMDSIMKVADANDLVVTEDCCEALGSTYGGKNVGSFGVAAAWSFFFSHHMTTMEGGMVTTDDPSLAQRLRSLRSHGWARHFRKPPPGDPRFTFVDWGFNLRPTEVSAAIGLVQLSDLNRKNAIRADNWKKFAEVLNPEKVVLPCSPDHGSPAWFGLPLLVDGRDSLKCYLEERGIETRPILAGNLARQPVQGTLRIPHGELPGAEYLHNHGLYLGLHPKANDDVIRVAETINEWAA